MATKFKRVRASELSDAKPLEWILPGLFAKRAVTLLTGAWKGGKTTFLTALLGKMTRGGTLAGREVRGGSALVVTEESESLWRERYDRVGFTDAVEVIAQPFVGRPKLHQWEDLIEDILNEAPVPDLIVFDPVAKFLPGHAESYAPALLDALGPLHLLTEAGACVTLPHHPSKLGRRDLISRGSSALNGEVDIEAKFHLVPDALNDRCRRVEVKSRPFGFNQDFQIEMTTDGTDYVPVEEEPDFLSYEFGLSVIRAILSYHSGPLTRIQLLKAWLEDFDRPSPTTLRRWLQRAVREGRLERHGTGVYHDAYRYGVPGQIEDNSPLTRQQVEEMMANAAKILGEAKERMRRDTAA